MKKSIIILAAGMALLAALGCGPLDYFLEKSMRLVQGPPKTKPAFSIAGKSIVILVDVANQDLLARYPDATYAVAKEIARELSDVKAARSIVNPRDVVTYAQTTPDYGAKSAIEIGDEFKVDQVLHVVIHGYVLERSLVGDSFAAQASIGLRVLDVRANAQAFPGLGQEHFVEVRSQSGIRRDTTSAAEKVLLEGLALKVGQVFVPYNIETLPLGPEVR